MAKPIAQPEAQKNWSGPRSFRPQNRQVQGLLVRLTGIGTVLTPSLRPVAGEVPPDTVIVGFQYTAESDGVIVRERVLPECLRRVHVAPLRRGLLKIPPLQDEPVLWLWHLADSSMMCYNGRYQYPGETSTPGGDIPAGGC